MSVEAERKLSQRQESRDTYREEEFMIEKEISEKMIGVAKVLAVMLEVTFQAFRKMSEDAIQGVQEAGREAKRASAELTGYLVTKDPHQKEKEWLKPYLSMASSLDRMVYNMEGISHQLEMMIQDGIPFSDRAINEINSVFQEVMDLLENLPDLILTQNKLLAQQMGEKIRMLLKIANGYSDEHEERLIQGVCMPKSSPIYLAILECLKGVTVQILEISGKLVSLGH